MDTSETKGQHSCKSCGTCDGCGHDSHFGMCGHGHWGHVLLKIAVALIIFWCGVQFGELKAVLHGGYAMHGYGMMERSPMYAADAVTVCNPNMMSSGWARETSSSVPVAIPTAAPTSKK